MGEVTQLLADLCRGKQEVTPKLIPLVYEELRRLARHYMRLESPGHTLQTTALIHEAYLRLIEQRETTWQNRAHFFAVAAQSMRRILVDHARASQTAKRGGDAEILSLDQEPIAFSQEKSSALDEALTRLADLSPRQTQIIELRFFGGLSVEETAEALQIAPRTVKRDWKVARAWLHREVRGPKLEGLGPELARNE
jgi:RNA polymerase sigma-70 factor (ECF subfamily)